MLLNASCSSFTIILFKRIVRGVTRFALLLILTFSIVTEAQKFHYYFLEGKDRIDTYKYFELATVVYSDLHKSRETFTGAFGHKYRVLDVNSGSDGFRAVSFLDKSTKKIIIAIAGTDDPSDGLADLELTQETVLNSVMKPRTVNEFLKFRTIHPDSLITGKLKLTEPIESVLDSQINQAFLFFERTLEIYSKNDISRISVAGHSWGGFLSQMIAAKYGISGHTMSAPGVPKSTLYRHGITVNSSLNLKNHGRISDPVFKLGDHIGETITYPETVAETFNSRLPSIDFKSPLLVVKEHSSKEFIQEYAMGNKGLNTTKIEKENSEEISKITKSKSTKDEAKGNTEVSNTLTTRDDFNLIVIEPKTGKILFELIDKSNSSSILPKSEGDDLNQPETTTGERKAQGKAKSKSQSDNKYWIGHEGSMLDITLSKVLEWMKCMDDDACREILYAEIEKIVSGCTKIENFEDCPKKPDLGLVSEQEEILNDIEENFSQEVIVVDTFPNADLNDRKTQIEILNLQNTQLQNMFFEKNFRSDRLTTDLIKNYLDSKFQYESVKIE